MDGQIIEESSSYRHGVVLGLTMAEIMLLLVFCLLIAMATVLSIEEDKRVKAEESLHLEQATNREDQDLVAAIKRHLWVLGTLRSAVHSGDGGVVDEFWRELVDSRTAIIEFKKDGVSLSDLHEGVAVVNKLKEAGIDTVAMLHDPEVVGSIRKTIATAAKPSAFPPAMPDAVRPGRDDGPCGHQWPPIITLSEADGHFFKSGSAELSPEFRQELMDSLPDHIAARMKQFGVDVIEVVGHTDEQPLGARQSNLDHDLPSVLRSDTNIANLIPADNAGLGLARAVSVVSVLRKSKTLAGYKLIPLSGAQLVNIDETLAIAGTRGDIPERRRIEIRLRKSAPHESSPTAPTLPVALAKQSSARPKVPPPGGSRSATPAAAPRTAAPSLNSAPDARNHPWWQLF
jgi:outer membrane protein OmpA-like peptidoglycan-associated protein